MNAPLLKNRDFLLLWGAHFTATVGVRIQETALLSLLFAGEHTTHGMSRLFFWEFLPWLIVGPFLGPWIDRNRKKPVLVFSDLARAGLTLLLVPLYLAGFPVSSFYPVIFLNGVLTSLFSPARTAALADIVGLDRIHTANAAVAITGVATVPLGAPLGLYLTYRWGLPACVAINALAFCLSASLILRIRHRLPAGSPDAARGTNDLLDGFRHVRHNPALIRLLVFTGIFWALVTATNLASADFSKRVMGAAKSSQGVFVSFAAFAAAGALAGAAAMGWMARRLRTELAYLAASAGLGAALILLSRSHTPAWISLWGFLAGAFGGGLTARIDADFVRLTPEAFRGRVLAVSGVAFAAGMIVPMRPVGILSLWVGPDRILSWIGLAYLAASCLWLTRLKESGASGAPQGR